MTSEGLSTPQPATVAHVDRLLNLQRRSKMDDIEAALGALGKTISIEVRSAA